MNYLSIGRYLRKRDFRMYDPLTFWETRANNWIEQVKTSPTEKEWSWIEPYVNPEWNVLELGCGTGRFAPFFKYYTGTDISPTLLVHAKEKYPNKQFFHHDMRENIKGDYDLIFTCTAWLHVPPEAIKKVKLPDTNYLFVEPTDPSNVEYCFNHDLPLLFGVKPLEKHDKLTLFGKLK